MRVFLAEKERFRCFSAKPKSSRKFLQASRTHKKIRLGVDALAEQDPNAGNSRVASMSTGEVCIGFGGDREHLGSMQQHPH